MLVLGATSTFAQMGQDPGTDPGTAAPGTVGTRAGRASVEGASAAGHGAALFRPRVLVVVYDPDLPGKGHPVSTELAANDPGPLVDGFVAGVRQASGGMVAYQVVATEVRRDFPPHEGGFRWTPDAYLEYRAALAAPEGSRAAPARQPPPSDYRALDRENRLSERVRAGEIDEVWFFGFHGFEWNESWMYGQGAFWINGPAIPDDSTPPFAVFGFNLTRGLGCMLHDLGHRIESTMDRVFGGRELGDPEGNPWERFVAIDRDHPGRAGVGTVHLPPNAIEEYQDDRPVRVASTAEDWLAYPELTGRTTEIGPEAWGGAAGDCQEAHIRWWLAHLPRAPGKGGLDGRDGTENNWWKYVYGFRDYRKLTGGSLLDRLRRTVRRHVSEAVSGLPRLVSLPWLGLFPKLRP